MDTNRTDQKLNLVVVGETNIQERTDPAEAFQHVAHELKGADALIGHMEGLLFPPSSDPQKPDASYKPGWRHSSPESIEAFKSVGFSAVTCASNVATGVDPVLNTIECLKKADIAFSGIGVNKEEAHKAALFESKGVRFGLLGYTSVYWQHAVAADDIKPGASTVKAETSYKPDRRALEMPGAPPVIVTKVDADALNTLTSDIKRYRDKVDILITSFHWGLSSQDYTVEYQREIAHASIEAGADMVLGHHPHVIQAMEIYKGSPVFYSLGNFAFDWWKMRERNLDGLALKCEISNKRISKILLKPSHRNTENDVSWVAEDDPHYQNILDRIEKLSIEEFDSYPGPSIELG